MQSLREKRLRGAFELELFSVGWITCEAVFSAVAAYRAGSLALSAFSVDSAIELVSAMLLVVRLYVEIHTGASVDRRHPVERWTSGFVAMCLFALAAYVAVKSGQAIRLQEGPSVTWLGLAVALASSVITPWLAVEKLRYGQLLDSPALCGDAMCSFTCGYMSWTLLAGVVMNDLFHWWWVDPLAACGILYFVVKEGWESVGAFVAGDGHTHSHSH